jgi:hypothetical protein
MQRRYTGPEQCSLAWMFEEAGIAQSVHRRATGWMAGVRFPAGQEIFLYSVQTCRGVHPVSYPMGKGEVSSGVKTPGREAYH